MALWNSDEELFALSRAELFTAVVGDVCDTLGLRRQFLPPHIRSIHHGLEVKLMIGRAMPVLEMDVEGEPTDGHPFGKMLDALDDIQRHEVYVCAGASPTYALVGELMSNAMLALGSMGLGRIAEARANFDALQTLEPNHVGGAIHRQLLQDMKGESG